MIDMIQTSKKRFNRITNNYISNADKSDYKRFELNKLILRRIGEME